MAQPRSVEDAKKTLSKKAALVAKMLATPEGQALVALIEEEFCTGKTGLSLLGETPHRMAYNVGAFDVVLYLKQLQRHHTKSAVDPLD
jgi:hypothetical protein